MRRRGLDRYFYIDRIVTRLAVYGAIFALAYLAAHLIFAAGRP